MFNDQSEKFAAARHALMLPHPKGEEQSIADAFFECSLGLEELNRRTLSVDVLEWITRLENLMNTEGLSDPNKEGLYKVKAKNLTLDEKIELSRIIDELAFWFHDNE